MTKKRKYLRLLESALFLAVLVCVIAAASAVVERKASRVKFQPFLERPQDYDVLFIGDSHVYNGVFPMELWDDYGIASYNIACYGNTVPVSYWSMMQALDYASPKLMVIGVKDVEKDYKVTGSSADVHTALDSFPLSRTKIRAVYDLMDDPYAVDDEGNRYADIRWEYFFKLGKYHSRWSELEASDFFCKTNVQKGAGMAVNVAVPDDYNVIDDYAEERGWGYTYLRRMTEECMARGIEVLLVHMPYPADEDDQTHGNTVASIAEEYGVNYIDFVNLDQVADYMVDCYDSDSHLNPSGARKTTDYLGRYIVDHYGVPDRREDPAYSHWYGEHDAYVGSKLEYITAQKSLKNLLMLLHDDDFSVCAAVRGGSSLYDDDTLYTLMHNIVREHVFESDGYSKWSGSLFPLAGLDEEAWDAQPYLLIADRARGTFAEYAGEQAAEHEASFGTVRYDAQGDDVSLLVEQGGAQINPFAGQDGAWSVRLLVIDDRTGEIAAALQY